MQIDIRLDGGGREGGSRGRGGGVGPRVVSLTPNGRRRELHQAAGNGRVAADAGREHLPIGAFIDDRSPSSPNDLPQRVADLGYGVRCGTYLG